MKNKNRYVCRECGYTTITWIGKCPECSSWNSFVEELVKFEKIAEKEKSPNKSIICINEITDSNESILKTSVERVNFFFNEGIVTGSVVLISGEPGIGKSTLLLYFSSILEKNKIFYFSGEESVQQVKKRCIRLNINNNLFVSNEIEVESIIDACKKNKPDILFIDSIQTIHSIEIDSLRGTISQIKYCTNKLIDYAKEFSVPVFIISHITKSGDIAGPKLLEHMVDMVIYFEGGSGYNYRILRSTKNRFGSTNEILVFEMRENGLNLVVNPSGYFIEDVDGIEEGRADKFIGKARTITIEGKIPLILETEALVVPSSFSNPRRFSEGADLTRLNRISAILDKYTNENFNNYDIYFNISGGIRTKDVGIDLSMAFAIYSSKNKKEINKDFIFIGELSLTGKIRPVQQLEKRIGEAIKFGARKIIIPRNKIAINDPSLTVVSDIGDAIKYVFS